VQGPFCSSSSTIAAISHMLEMVASSMDMVSRVGRSVYHALHYRHDRVLGERRFYPHSFTHLICMIPPLYFSREVGGGEAAPATFNRPEAVPGVTGQSLSIGGRDEQEGRGIAWG
jgi:hypothetical protein